MTSIAWGTFAVGVLVGIGLVAATAIAVGLKALDRAMTPAEATWT